MQVPAGGGTPAPVTSLGPEQKGHQRPQFISDERFLFHAIGGEQSRGIHVATITSPETRGVLDAEVAHLHVPSRQLLFVRNGTLMAQRFDADRLTVAGVVHAIAEGIILDGTVAGAPALSVAAAGPSVYRTWPRSPLQLADGQSAAISPDGRWLAYSTNATGGTGTELWIRRLAPEEAPSAEGSRQRGSADGGRRPVWRADGSELFFMYSGGHVMSSRLRVEEQGLEVGMPVPLFPGGPVVGIQPRRTVRRL